MPTIMAALQGYKSCAVIRAKGVDFLSAMTQLELNSSHHSFCTFAAYAGQLSTEPYHDLHKQYKELQSHLFRFF